MTVPDPADVTLIAEAIAAAYDPGPDNWDNEARVVLAVLAGRLLPQGGQVRTEVKHVHRDMGWNGPYCGERCLRSVTHSRAVTAFPDGTVVTGPWKGIDGGG